MMITGPKICDSHDCPHGCQPLTGCEGHARRLRADAQTPVQPLGYIPADAVEQLAPPRLILSSIPIYTYEGVGTVPIYLAPSQQDRAVMQAMDKALRILESSACTKCECRGCELDRAEAESILRAALFATMEKP